VIPRALALIFLAAIPQLVAQRVMTAERIAPLLKQIEGHSNQPLKCEAQPLRPFLNYGLRFQAGYSFTVPLKQYVGPRHAWLIVTEISPEGGITEPVYLLDIMHLPPVEPNKLDAIAGGSYLLGEGKYRVRWMLLDDQERVCTQNWKIDVHKDRSMRDMKVAMQPGAVASLSLRGLRGTHIDTDIDPIRLTILLDAAPLFSPRRAARTGIGPGDQAVLLGMLSAFLERVPASSVRLVAFNLEQQRELYRQEDFTLSSIDRLRVALNSVSLATVDVGVLQNRRGYMELFADLINTEARTEQKSDAVVVLGPRERFEERLPAEALDDADRSGGPRFFYFQWRPRPNPSRLLVANESDASVRGPGPGSGASSGRPPRMQTPELGGGDFPDLVSNAIDRMKGETYRIHSPSEFAKAIARLERQFAKTK
jgi:hypothetical protein